MNLSVAAVLHLVLHVLVPVLAARVFWPDAWRRAWLIMLATMLVDADHLLASPIYDPGRCSIGFHPLHTAPAILLYVLLLLPAKTRIVATGLLLHMVLDAADCVTMSG